MDNILSLWGKRSRFDAMMNAKVLAGILSLLFIVPAIFILFPVQLKRENVVLPVVADYEYAPIVERTDLRVGVVPGPYGELFMKALMPSLKNLGYTFTFVHYDDYEIPNFALTQHEIDVNMFQHYKYLNDFKSTHDLALSAITEIPTIAMGVYSYRYRSVDHLESGITVAIPDDSSNLARALRVLASANIISLDPFIDRSKATIGSIVSNPYNVQIRPIAAHNLVTALKEYDLSVISGNYALSGGLNPTESLYTEVLEPYYINVVVVRTDDLNKKFVRDIISIIHSDNFRAIVDDPNGKYKNFQRPRNFYSTPIETGRIGA